MITSHLTPSRKIATALALVATLGLGLGEVQARPKGGMSGGSRGSHTNVAPPTTNTAPRQAQPLPDSTPRATTPSPAAAPSPGASAARPAAPAAPASSWKSGLMGGIAGGLLGAGLFGMLSGNGFMGGLGSLMGLLGFVAQIAILFFIVRFAINFFRRKQAQPAMAGGMAGGPNAYARDAMQPQWQPSQAAAQPVPSQPLTLAEADFSAFERLLGEIQLAYGAGDRIALTQRATPEMANDFNAELAEMARAGITNRISDVKLLQGDLSEAWREPGAEYATVTMRYSLIDAKIERASGKIVEGDATKPQEVIEYWTFVRAPGETTSDWKLSAIQQMS